MSVDHTRIFMSTGDTFWAKEEEYEPLRRMLEAGEEGFVTIKSLGDEEYTFALECVVAVSRWTLAGYKEYRKIQKEVEKLEDDDKEPWKRSL